MPFDWSASAAINFNSNAVALFGRIEKASASLTAMFEKLDKAAAALDATLTKLGGTATGVADQFDDLTTALGASTNAARRASRAYNTVARSAARAGVAAAAAQNAIGTSSAAVTPASVSRRVQNAVGSGFGVAGMLTGAAGLLPGVGGVLGRVGSMGLDLGKHAVMPAVGAGIDALYESGHLQSVLTSIMNVTGAGTNGGLNDPRMLAVRQQLFDVGNMAAMSPTETGKMFREIARQSQGALSLKSQEALLPLMAKAQTVIGTTRGYSPEQTTDAMMSYVHLMRLYDPKKMMGPSGFDLATRMFELIPTAPAQTIRQLAYFVPQLKSLGVSDQQSDALMLTLARAGYGQGKGGTGLASLAMESLGPLQITSFAQAQKSGLLKKYGLLDDKGMSNYFHDRGNSNIIQMLTDLSAVEKKIGGTQFAKLTKSMFGVQGGRIADLLSNPEVAAQIINSQKALAGQESLGLNSQFSKFMSTFDKQAERDWQNFQGLMTEIGTVALPGATVAARDFGNAIYGASKWLNEHKQLEKEMSDYILGMVHNVENYVRNHEGDFKAIGVDLLRVGTAIDMLGKAAMLAVGPLTTASRIVMDIGTLNFKDIKSAMDEASMRQVQARIGALPNHAARAAAWQQYAAQFGTNNLPAGVMGSVQVGLKHAQAVVKATQDAGKKRASGISGGPMGATSLQINVDARGATDPAATGKHVHAGVVSALADPRSQMALNGGTLRTHAAIPAVVSVLGA